MAARIEYKASVAKDLRKLDRAEAIRAVNRLERVLAAEGLRGEALSGEFAGPFLSAAGERGGLAPGRGLTLHAVEGIFI